MSFSVKIIRESFNKTRPISEQVTAKFYDTLFDNHPEARGLFESIDLVKQRQLLYNSLDFIVTNLENPDRLSEYLQNLGERHVSYGTEEDHFPWVGEALLGTFAHFFGEEWTDELAENWTAAFSTIADYMKLGMRSKINNVVSLKSSSSSVPFELPEQAKKQIRDMVRASIAEALQDEVKRVMEEELQNLVSEEKLAEMLKALKGAA